ncbi:MAG: saccharopine dehydrogenase C-terminal domain-containing protein [Thermonemataceae bacterium]|nr:saccharopine dehydrogenase C-terminal domain-containing protein [Thermonemataceae bacterium]
MKKILVLGAGRSASSLIRYLAENAPKYAWQVSIADAQKELVLQKIQAYPHLTAYDFDIFETKQAQKLIAANDIVISLLPPALHIHVARFCLDLGKNMLTASYISKEMQALDAEVRKKNLIFLNEIGLDPGIDHLSAMKIIDEIRSRGGEIKSFKSFTGGLIAPESDNNPWHYKFTWNPQNVILAGQGVAKYLENKQIKYIPYHQLFRRIAHFEIKEYGIFEGYANRDSLSYQKAYGLENIDTLLRGTLRKQNYCEAWDCFVQLGMTDNITPMPTQNLSYQQFLATFLPPIQDNIQETFSHYLALKNKELVLNLFTWLDFFTEKPINYPQAEATPAQILQHILEQKWQLQVEDKDMIVMQHLIDYEENKEKKTIVSELVVIGEDSTHTAMAKTVGLPLAIACKLILEGKITSTGVLMPLTPNIYEPILSELQAYGISFSEYHK